MVTTAACRSSHRSAPPSPSITISQDATGPREAGANPEPTTEPSPQDAGTATDRSMLVPPPCAPSREINRMHPTLIGALKEPSSRLVGASVQATDPELAASVDDLLARPLRWRQDRFVDEWRTLPMPFRSQAALEITCKHLFARKYLVSVGCEVYEHLAGAHPNIGYIATNLWTCGARPTPIAIEAICDASCKQGLFEMVARTLEASGKGDIARSLREETEEGEDVFQTFVVSKAGLTFSFRDSLPHVFSEAGMVEIDFDKLDAIMDKSATYRMLRDVARS
jgi:hypothetical protein